MKFINKSLSKIYFTIFSFLLPVLVFAQGDSGTNPPNGGSGTNPPAPTSKIINPLESETISELIQKVLEGLIKIGMPILVLAIIYSGFLFVTAQGKSEKLTEAKQALLYTLIGSAILLGSWAIAQMIAATVTSL